MDDPVVIKQQGGPGFHHREAQSARASRFEHPGLATLDRMAFDQDDRHEVDPVAVRALRGRTTDAPDGIDTELMRLDIPAFGGAEACQKGAQTRHQRLPGWQRQQCRFDRLVPTLETTVKRVVIHRLPVGPLRGLVDGTRGGLHNEAGVSSPAVMTAVTQIAIRGQVAPDRTRDGRFGHRGAGDGFKARRGNQCKPLAYHRGGNGRRSDQQAWWCIEHGDSIITCIHAVVGGTCARRTLMSQVPQRG